jgi:hypothetical protein
MNLNPAKKQQLLAQLEQIIAELKRLGIWDMSMTEEEIEGSFIGQLRHRMIPGIQARFSEELPLPKESNLGAIAVRELDGQSTMEPLTNLLCEFDEIYNEDA